MLSRMDASVFDIPLLTDEIAKCLCPHDLTRRVLVSRGWNASFTPRLWRCISTFGSITANALIKNQEHIRTIDSLSSRIAQHLLFRPQNIQTMRHDMRFKGVRSTKLLHFLESIPFLQSLSVTVRLSAPDARWFKMLEQQTGLRHPFFDCTSDCIPATFVAHLIQSCHRLHSLTLNVCVYFSKTDYQLDHAYVKSIVEGMDDTQFRELSLDASHEFGLLVVPILLERSPLLERFLLPKSFGEDELRKTVRVFGNKKHSRLKHLRIKDFPRRHKEIIYDLFSTTIGYEMNSNSNADYIEGLQSLEIDNQRGYVLKPLARYFSKSLTELIIHHSPINIQLAASSLQHLEKLEFLKADISLDNVREDGSNTNITLATAWICLGLKRLKMEVFRDTRFQGGEDSIVYRLVEYIFTQIGRLANLEDMTPSTRIYSLDRSGGYLRKLTGLERLRELELHISDYKITIEDAQWMLKHWKRSLHLCLIVRTYADRLAIKELKSMRPRIQVNTLKSIKYE